MNRKQNVIIGAIIVILAVVLTSLSATSFFLNRRKDLGSIPVAQALTRSDFVDCKSLLKEYLPDMYDVAVIDFSITFDSEDNLNDGYMNFVSKNLNGTYTLYQLNKNLTGMPSILRMSEKDYKDRYEQASDLTESALYMITSIEADKELATYSYEHVVTNPITKSLSPQDSFFVFEHEQIMQIDSLENGNYLCIQRSLRESKRYEKYFLNID